MRSSQIHTTLMRQHSLRRLFFLILFFRERFNLESFIGLGFIWSCERCRRIKSSIERGGKRLTRLLKGLESFWSTMERKARASGTGAENPITWLCSFNTFYASFFLKCSQTLARFLFFFNTLNTGIFSSCRLCNAGCASVRSHAMRQGSKKHNE